MHSNLLKFSLFKIHFKIYPNILLIADKIGLKGGSPFLVYLYTFSNLDNPNGKEINYITNPEKRITSDLKLLKDEESIDKATYKSIKPIGPRLGVL